MEFQSATLWMGEIGPDMDKAFVIEAFANMGYTAIDVKEIFSKTSGERANYCFVDFGDVNIAREVFIKVNNEPIPGTEKKFKLNRSEYGRSNPNKETEYSLFVGDLSSDVTDNQLLDFFRVKYSSARAANVVKDELGNPKGFGFVRFFNEEEHTKALREMQGAKGLGQRQIRVNRANKSKSQGGNSGHALQPGSWSGQNPPEKMPQWMQMQMQYMQQMQQYMQQCHQYAQQAAQYAGWNQQEGGNPDGDKSSSTGMKRQNSDSSDSIDNTANFMNIVEKEHAQMLSKATEIEEDQELVDPDEESFVDIAAMNREIIENDDRLFFELEASRWDFKLSFVDAYEPRLVKTRGQNTEKFAYQLGSHEDHDVIPPKSYDVLCSSGAFFVTRSHPGFECFRKLCKLVKQGGYIVIVTGNAYITKFSFTDFSIVEGLEKEGLLKILPKKTFEEYRKAHGHETKEYTYGAILTYQVF